MSAMSELLRIARTATDQNVYSFRFDCFMTFAMVMTAAATTAMPTPTMVMYSQFNSWERFLCIFQRTILIPWNSPQSYSIIIVILLYVYYIYKLFFLGSIFRSDIYNISICMCICVCIKSFWQRKLYTIVLVTDKRTAEIAISCIYLLWRFSICNLQGKHGTCSCLNLYICFIYNIIYNNCAYHSRSISIQIDKVPRIHTYLYVGIVLFIYDSIKRPQTRKRTVNTQSNLTYTNVSMFVRVCLFSALT